MSTRSRRKFTPEFEAEAVEMVKAADGNIAQVAREMGIYDSTSGNWVRQARDEAAGAPALRSARRSDGDLAIAEPKRARYGLLQSPASPPAADTRSSSASPTTGPGPTIS